LTPEFGVKSKALRNATKLLKTADKQVKKLQSVVADHKDKIEQLLVRTNNLMKTFSWLKAL
jgi:hypothetical protein